MAVTNHQLINTPDYRRHLITLLFIQIAGLILTAGFIAVLLYQINVRIDERIFRIAAVIENDYPGSLEKVIPVLLDDAPGLFVQPGKEYLARFGYLSGSLKNPNPVYSGMLPSVVAGFCILSLIITALNYSGFLFNQKRLYGRIAELSDCIISILDGKPAFGKTKHKEGIVDLFVCRFNQMVKLVQSSTEKLSGEKLFLRNIISDISHQLKTPLASLIMYNDLMIEEPHMEEARRAEFLTVCRNQLERLEWLIKSLLQLGKLGAGAISFEKTPLNILEPINRAVENLQPLAGEINLSISDNRNEIHMIPGDTNWLREAFINILKNAIQHVNPQRGVIRITLSDTPLFLKISVKDNGSGIPEAELPRIFERFYKGSNSTGMQNVGIGLSLAKMITEAHNGDIRASGSDGNGAEFIITLPY